jgi:two-component system, NarL family, response regulator DevR
MRIAELISQGLGNKEIGFRLGLTENTVKAYVSKIFSELGFASRLQLALAYLHDDISERPSPR